MTTQSPPQYPAFSVSPFEILNWLMVGPGETVSASIPETQEISLYYNRLPNVYAKLTGPVEEMMTQLMNIFDSGFDTGTLCSNSFQDLKPVIATGKENRQVFKDAARKWLMACHIRTVLP